MPLLRKEDNRSAKQRRCREVAAEMESLRLTKRNERFAAAWRLTELMHYVQTGERRMPPFNKSVAALWKRTSKGRRLVKRLNS